MKTKKVARRRALPKPKPKAELLPPDPLLPKQRAFVLEYLSNRGNATRAYLASHPDCKSYASASQAGYMLLRNREIQIAIEKVNGDRWRRMEMSGDEAMARIANVARADIADAYDDDGALRPVNEWPDELRMSVRSIKANGDIVLHDGLKARELIAVSTGRIRAGINLNLRFDHAKYLTDEKDDA